MAYETWAKEDVKLWGDVSVAKIKGILENIPLTKNAESTCKILKRKGYLLAVISTGLNFVIERLKNECSIDYAVCNELSEDKSGLSVKVNVSLDKKPKEKVLENLLSNLRMERENTIAVGDTDDEAEMMKAASFSVLFNPDPNESDLARKYASVVVESKDLKDILPYL
ncbi:hypothetical protein COY23_02230 [bacterium (Candidatus Torokbacteria) CG_4_10_14_0_2_um_filter_35_8]|nr:MAG: hypothetical protein COY23_02230 [bacterium (Candidatus Torokbacteria) CG_4_10_14_0_2_um_filter_35_8]